LKLLTGVFVRPNGGNLAKVLTAGKRTDAWGVVPDPGFEILHSPKEKRLLAEHFELREIVPRSDRPFSIHPPGFRDVVLELAVEQLRRRLPVAK
jgi:hypothetical protein